MTPQEYEEEKKFVLGELADDSYFDKHGAIPDLLKPFADDKDVALAAVKREGSFLEHFSTSLRDDEHIVRLAVSNSGNALIYGSERLKDDRGVVQAACENIGTSLWHASERLKNNSDFIAELSKDNYVVFNAMGLAIRSNKQDYLQLLEKTREFHKPELVMHWASENIKKIVGDGEPIKALQASILHDKLNQACKPKVESQARKMKI